jgi:hypothetical protein
MQSGELVARALRQHFNTPVVIIANPTGDSEQMRFAFDEPAEAYALHSSSYYEAASFDGFFCHHDFVSDKVVILTKADR